MDSISKLEETFRILERFDEDWYKGHLMLKGAYGGEAFSVKLQEPNLVYVRFKNNDGHWIAKYEIIHRKTGGKQEKLTIYKGCAYFNDKSKRACLINKGLSNEEIDNISDISKQLTEEESHA